MADADAGATWAGGCAGATGAAGGLGAGGAGGCGAGAGAAAAGRAGATWICGAQAGISTTAGHCVSGSCDEAGSGAVSGAHAGTAVLPRWGAFSASRSLGAGAGSTNAGVSGADTGALASREAGGTVLVDAAAAGGTVACGVGAVGTVAADGGGTVAGGTVAACDGAGDTVAGGTVAGGTVAFANDEGGTVAGGTVAGGTVDAGFTGGDAVPGGSVLAAAEPELAAGACVARGAAGFHSDGVGPAGRSGSCGSASPNADGGQAGIVCSVGGSGGQMSLWVGSGASG